MSCYHVALLCHVVLLCCHAMLSGCTIISHCQIVLSFYVKIVVSCHVVSLWSNVTLSGCAVMSCCQVVELCHIVRFSCHDTTEVPPITIGGEIVERSEKYKYLGIILDNKLKFESNV